VINYLPRIIVDDLLFKEKENTFKGGICICNFSNWSHYHEVINYLHPKEKEYYDRLNIDNRKKSYLIGRYAAKRAISFFTGENNYESILIQWGIFNQPVVINKNLHNIQTSITHSGNYGAAVVFPESLPIGIDIEKIDPRKNFLLEKQITSNEGELINSFLYPHDTKLTILWTVKEALSKVIKSGLTATLDIFEVNKIELKQNYVVNYFTHFYQYCAISFELDDRYICSITYPKNVELFINIASLQEHFCRLLRSEEISL